MKELTLLIGNGINRLGKANGPSWSQLLNSLQHEIDCTIDLNNDFKPFPMAFEEMLMTNCTNYINRLRSFKQSISKTFLDAIPNEYHHKIVHSSSISNILTTNYDYSFERVLVPEFTNLDVKQTAFVTKEIKYSLRRRNSINKGSIEKNIWHIHGELYDPKNYQSDKKRFKEESILIGYEHYSEALKVMQDYKNGRNKWASTPLKKKLLEPIHLGSSWIDYFFTSKLIMTGIDLSFSEIDLWWLLNFRARWLKEFGPKKNVPSSINSEIVFCYPTFTDKQIIEVAKANRINEDKVRRDMEKKTKPEQKF